MFKEIHGLNLTIHGVKKNEIITLCDEYLRIKFNSFTIIKEVEDEYFEVRYKFPKEETKESVYIKFKNKNTESMTIVNLKGSFFDNSPDFKLTELLAWLSNYKWTPKQLDVAYVDDESCLSIEKIIHWCENKNKFCTGSLFKKRPKILREERDFDSIRLAKATSTINYGTIYVRPDTGYVRIEIKLKNLHKIHYLLDVYDEINTKKFNIRTTKILVSCIDFITSKSKKTRDPDQYVRFSSWARFLNSNPRKIAFKDIVQKRRETRFESERLTFDKKINRTATMVKNMISRLSAEHSLDDIFRIFSEKSGYKLTIIEPCTDNFMYDVDDEL